MQDEDRFTGLVGFLDGRGTHVIADVTPKDREMRVPNYDMEYDNSPPPIGPAMNPERQNRIPTYEIGSTAQYGRGYPEGRLVDVVLFSLPAGRGLAGNSPPHK